LPPDSLTVTTVADTTGQMPTDTTLALTDSIALDSLGRMSTPSLVGTYDRALDSSHYLTKEDLHWFDYRYLGGILETVPGVHIREQNSEGQYSQLNIRGMDWRGIAITMDGRPMNDPASGVYNLFHFTTEYADRIEFITGPRAFLYGLNSSGGAVNLITKNYNSNRAFSKLNYSESAWNASYSDGTFSQNISRKINFTFGFQHQSTDGRFVNSAHEAWNMRVKARYNLSRDFNIILSEYLTRTQTQLNGGVDYAASGPAGALTPLEAMIRNTDAFEKVSRHDVDLSLVGTIVGDTANVSMLTFYYSNNLREYRDEENRSTPNGLFIKSDHRSSWTGVVFTQNFDTELQRFDLAVHLELRQVEASPNIGRRKNVVGSLRVKEEVILGPFLTVAGYGRYDHYRKKGYTGFGTDATLRLVDGLALFGGLSFSRRFPNYQELFWSDSTVSRTEPLVPEKHRQVEVGARIRVAPGLSLRVAYFHRTVDDALTFSAGPTGSVFPTLAIANINKVTTNGVEATLDWRFWVLAIEGNGTLLLQKTREGTLRDFPRTAATGGVYFWQTLLDNKLDLKTGFRGKYLAAHVGMEFNPEILAYIPGGGPQLGLGSSVDFIATAHIGDAYIHLVWENLTNIGYFTTPYYPALDRAVRFGISWEFLN
jgi:outer membrane cobalamin receptor